MGIAETFGGPGLFLLAFFDSSFLSFPEVVDVLMIGLVARYPERMLWYAAMSSLGSIAGSYVIYALARRGGEAFLRRRLHERHVDRAFAIFRKYGLLAVAIPSIMPPPVPFKIFILAAGAARVKPLDFLIAVSIGRERALLRRGRPGGLVRRGRPPQHRGIRRRAQGPHNLGSFARDSRAGDLDLVVPQPSPSGLTRTRKLCIINRLPVIATMQPEISVVVPMRNESLNVEQLYRELTSTLEAFGRSFEVLAIDDGSSDDTFRLLAALHATDPRLRVIRFRRNFGQTAAFAAGFAHARGRFIVTSDGDLQNNPADIPAMIRLIEQGPDIVAGWRKDRKDPFINRRLPSIIANAIISFATGVKLHDYGCSLKVFRAEVVKPMRLYGEMHRFLPAIASEQGVQIVEQVVDHRPRLHGQSKYGISRTIRVVLDLMTVKFLSSYSTRPLQMFGSLGVGMGMIGTPIVLYLVWVRLVAQQPIADRTPLMLLGISLILGGVQLVMTGLLGEMLSRTYHESQNKPTYLIRETLE